MVLPIAVEDFPSRDISIWEVVKGGYTPRVFQRTGGRGKTRPRNALPRVPACFKFNYDAPRRCSQLMPNTRNFVFFGHVVGANGTAALGSKRPPPTPPKLY